MRRTLRGRWVSAAPVRASQHQAFWTHSGPRAPGWAALTAGPLGWASELQGRGVGHCVERALAEDRLSCRHKQTPVACLTASQVERRRPLARTQTPQEACIHDGASGERSGSEDASPFTSAFTSLVLNWQSRPRLSFSLGWPGQDKTWSRFLRAGGVLDGQH